MLPSEYFIMLMLLEIEISLIYKDWSLLTNSDAAKFCMLTLNPGNFADSRFFFDVEFLGFST